MIVKQPFGHTGHTSSRAIFGSAAFWSLPQSQADAVLNQVFEFGVNHIDTAASYGEAEVRIGSWIKRHGKNFFLGTKTGERTRLAARQELERSLERLQVSQVDLLQLHNLVDEHEWEVAMGPGGALEAAIEARQAGLVRFIGVTGHGTSVAHRHLQALQRFDFDAVLLPLSYILLQNPRYRQDVNLLLQVCTERQVAVQTIKAITRAPWGDRPQTYNTWYEPLANPADIDLAVHWVLGFSGVFLNTVGDIQVLPRVLEAVDRFQSAPPDAAMQELLSRQQMAPLFE
jgi:aryl-alcohol dehydrogenase-like predicted oxidoreductase